MTEQAYVPRLAVASDLTIGDLARALKAGWRDFLAYPLFGLFFAGLYVAGGVLLYVSLSARDALAWLIPITAGFPLLAPFIAAGLYEVSRRREAGERLSWGGVLGALRGRGDEQLLMMGGFVFVAFSFWIIIAHGIFAIFLADAAIEADPLGWLLSTNGLLMLAVGGAAGALMAFALYSITVISLPMLIDQDVDFITAMIASMKTVQANTFVMLVWAALMSVLLFLSMAPLFLGLLVVLPVLAHATWHLYRRAIPVAPAVA
ncbi:DUF2189 domain-containing protein [Qipengyuania sp. YIM B01966]|uniref:DUF2189 domain-containing protein n=1 Tax=Qipengyuania sp. YIM B01966 TaxID=2778646 RepID=UPI0018F6C389|nr:DUF2189 domain-containing protein [Qipengyuania sp. YIM B01966]